MYVVGVQCFSSVIWLGLFSCLILTRTKRWVQLYLLRLFHYFCLCSQTHAIYETATKTMKYTFTVLFRLALLFFALRKCFVHFSTVVAMCFCVCKVSSFASSISTKNWPGKCSLLWIFLLWSYLLAFELYLTHLPKLSRGNFILSPSDRKHRLYIYMNLCICGKSKVIRNQTIEMTLPKPGVEWSELFYKTTHWRKPNITLEIRDVNISDVKKYRTGLCEQIR